MCVLLIAVHRVFEHGKHQKPLALQASGAPESRKELRW
jgi:hypothetical protein